MYTNYLYHHGIKGQKWGVRRYQNKDGSLTNAGQKRYGISGAIRGHQIRSAEKGLSKVSSQQRQVKSELRELRGYENAARKNPNSLGASKLSTAIRNSQIKSLEKTKSKLNIKAKGYNDALKELKSIDEYQAKKHAEKSSKPKMSTAKKVAIGAAVVAASAGITYAAIKAKNNKTVSKGMQAANKILNNQVDKANLAKKQLEAYNRAINNLPSTESMLNRSRHSVSVPKTSMPKPSVPKTNARSTSDSIKLARERLDAYSRSINNIQGPEDMLNRRRGNKFF